MSDDLSDRLAVIEARNRRVELDKKWETSTTRRFLIATITYVVAGTYMTFTKAAHPWVAAFVPTLGFGVSTLGIPIVRRKWQNKNAA